MVNALFLRRYDGIFPQKYFDVPLGLSSTKPSLSASRTTPRLPPHPLLRFPRQSLPTTEINPLPPIVGDEVCRESCPNLKITEGLSRPLRATHRRFPLALSGLPSRSHDSCRTARRRLHIPELRRHFMRTPTFPSLSPQTCRPQIQGEVSPDAAPSPSLRFRVDSARPMNPCSALTNNSAMTPLRIRSPLTAEHSYDPIPIAPAASRRFSPIHF